MDEFIACIFNNFGLTMFILAILIAAVIRSAKHSPTAASEIYLRWIFLLPLGITGLYAFIMHAFFGTFTAAAIGWSSSPFQYEVAMANLGFGVMGVLAYKASHGFRVATVVGTTCWLWGDAVGHIYQMITMHNFTVGNAGSWFWMDVLVPLMLIVLLVKTTRAK